MEPKTTAQVIEKAGGLVAVAEHFGISRQAVEQWVGTGKIPPGRVLDMEELTGISVYDLLKCGKAS